MSLEHRSLLMRANRLLGAQLVEHNLVRIEDLEAANERLLELISAGNPRQCTVLGVLAYEKKALTEEDVLTHLAETEGVGLIDLRTYDVHDEVKAQLDIGACWATWSVPFDKEDGFHCIATAYYLSPAVRAYWEKHYGTPVVWYATNLEIVADYLEKLEAERGAGGAAAATTPNASR